MAGLTPAIPTPLGPSRNAAGGAAGTAAHCRPRPGTTNLTRYNECGASQYAFSVWRDCDEDIGACVVPMCHGCGSKCRRELRSLAELAMRCRRSRWRPGSRPRIRCSGRAGYWRRAVRHKVPCASAATLISVEVGRFRRAMWAPSDSPAREAGLRAIAVSRPPSAQLVLIPISFALYVC